MRCRSGKWMRIPETENIVQRPWGSLGHSSPEALKADRGLESSTDGVWPFRGAVGGCWETSGYRAAWLGFPQTACPSCLVLLPWPLPRPAARAVGKERLWQASHSLCPSLGLGKEAAPAPNPQRASRAWRRKAVGKSTVPRGSDLILAAPCTRQRSRAHSERPLGQGRSRILPPPSQSPSAGGSGKAGWGMGSLTGQETEGTRAGSGPGPLTAKQGVLCVSPTRRGHRQPWEVQDGPGSWFSP